VRNIGALVPPGPGRSQVSSPGTGGDAASAAGRAPESMPGVARGGVLALAGTAAAAVLGFLLTVVVTRGLSATSAGEFFTVNFANTVLMCEHIRAYLIARGGGTLCVWRTHPAYTSRGARTSKVAATTGAAPLRENGNGNRASPSNCVLVGLGLHTCAGAASRLQRSTLSV